MKEKKGEILMKFPKIEFKPEKLLPVASAVLAVAGMVVSNAVQANEKKMLKAELKDELMKDLLSDKN